MARTRSTRSKLLLLIAVMALGSALVGAVGLVVFGKMERQETELSAKLLPSLLALSQVQDATAEIRFWSTRAIVLVSQKQLDELDVPWTKREDARQRGEKGLALLGSLELAPEVRDVYEKLAPVFRWMIDQNAQAWDAMRNGDFDGADRIMGGYSRKVQAELAEPLARGMDLQLQIGDRIRADSSSLAARARLLLWGALLSSIVGGVALGLLLARSVARSLHLLSAEAGRLREEVAEGRLGARADLTLVGEEFRPILAGMNDTMDAFASPIALTVDYLGRIAKGDLPPKITDDYQGDFRRIKDALNGCIDSLSNILGEIDRMATAQVAGDIEAFVNERLFEGAFQKVAAGVNANTRMHIETILEVLGVLEQYGEGDFTPVMRSLPGKQVVLNQTLDAIRSNLMAVAGEVQRLGHAAVEGKFAVRADASRFKGDWHGVVQGVNATVDAILSPLLVMVNYLERFSHGEIPPRRTNQVQGDVVAMQQSLNRCVDSLAHMVEDVDTLARSAVEGRLSARVDVARHEGAFRDALDGMNRTLDTTLAPVQEAAQTLERLAARDLRARMEGSYEGDHARMKESVNAMATQLHDAMAQVAQAVEQVSSASTQIASSSQAVASGASEQAASLEETTASLESVSGTTKHTAESAQQADHLARSARATASDGSAAVEQMQGAMARIRASAEGTSQIIRDINDIAFQTNLLALNAAVEAARAGEAGRGFAVVAEEVRSLALRAKEAASKTEELIKQSVKEAGQGEVTAGHVASKLTEIAGGVGKVTDIVAEIAAAAREQAAGIEQVTRAVGEMDKVTQQNAASAEESSSAASELSGQAEELAAMIGVFKLEVTAGAAGRRALPQAQRGGALARAAAPQGGRDGTSLAAKEQLFPMDPATVRDF